MLLLEQDIRRKRQVNKLLKIEPELNNGDKKKYKVKAIYDSELYAKQATSQLLGLYYFVS